MNRMPLGIKRYVSQKSRLRNIHSVKRSGSIPSGPVTFDAFCMSDRYCIPSSVYTYWEEEEEEDCSALLLLSSSLMIILYFCIFVACTVSTEKGEIED